ncbi:GNAT family N-acetyltransferase [Halobacillus halophilus]|uniref:GNAT family N-acetyltransferase n=1 Tax=Halobacillus halophilus TaxID=1570 RepID=UPI001CD22AEA|nr:GNAT family protein [Halobacillus halophilus]MCA1010983.1 GNAT family N-acetyltransferase [Halobacillus halophilus]
MLQKEAEEIARWKYNGIYSFYDITADEEDYQEFINEETRGKHAFSVYEGEQLIGFYSIIPEGSETVDLGLGLRPDMTGQGIGGPFLQKALEYAQIHYGARSFTLSVATFNERAIRVYEKAGFKVVQTFIQPTNGSEYEFVKMRKA